MKELELIDYTGNMFGSTFLYVLPGEYKTGERYKMMVGKVPAGDVRIVAVTVMPFARVTETISRIFMGVSKELFLTRYRMAYKLTDEMPVSVIAFEWTNLDTVSLKAMMEVRFDQTKGLRAQERSLQLNLAL